MLIASSFVPVLKLEIKRVREAMKTRGAGSVLNPKVFYRAFLVPLVMRLVGISDTLSLSVETRGFTLGKAKYTVYKREIVALSDVVFLLAIIAGAVLVVVL
jgi:energy-coupling factor transport system permease protein